MRAAVRGGHHCWPPPWERVAQRSPTALRRPAYFCGALQLLRAGAAAGQAVVQMARHSRSGLEYAIKFFVFPSTFHDESAIYEDRSSGLGQFADRLKLPRVRCLPHAPWTMRAESSAARLMLSLIHI